MVNRDEYRQLVLAGTVSFPATFPQVGTLHLSNEAMPTRDQASQAFLSVQESPSARVTMVRRVMAKSVRAVFVPNDPRNVNYADGRWLLADEVLPGLEQLFKAEDMVQGIIFVAESESSLLNVSVGMTAGESVQYYPPLPNDPAHNHYNAWPAGRSPRTLGGHAEMIDASSNMSLFAGPGVGSCEAEAQLAPPPMSCSSLEKQVPLKAQSVQAEEHDSAGELEALWSCRAYPVDM